MGTSSSPKIMERGLDDPGKSATEFSVLRTEEKPGGVFNLDLLGLVMIKPQVGSMCCPSAPVSPLLHVLLIEKFLLLVLGRQPGSHRGLVFISNPSFASSVKCR